MIGGEPVTVGTVIVAAGAIGSFLGPIVQKWRVRKRGPLDAAAQLQAMSANQVKMSAEFAEQMMANSVAAQKDAVAARLESDRLIAKLRTAEAETDALIQKLRQANRDRDDAYADRDAYGALLDANHIPRPIGAR